MRKAWIAVAGVALLVQGCAPATIIYGESRKVSRSMIAPVMVETAPTAANEAATTCILKGMTVAEVISLPNSAMGKQPDTLRGFVGEVATRPGVGDCIAKVTK